MRLVGVNIPDNKRVEIALTYIFGIGKTVSQKALKSVKIDPNKRAQDLTTAEVNTLKVYIEKNLNIEGDLKIEISRNIKRKKDINSYQGLRHIKRLPVRGQKTKTNSRTVRGNVRRTMGSGRKPSASKT